MLNKLRNSSCSILENLDVDRRRQLVTRLFPPGETHDPVVEWRDWSEDDWNEEWSIVPGEVYKVLKKREVSSNTSPGLDGVPAIAWKKVPLEFLDKVVVCFEACLRQGIFPGSWKRAGTYPEIRLQGRCG